MYTKSQGLSFFLLVTQKATESQLYLKKTSIYFGIIIKEVLLLLQKCVKVKKQPFFPQNHNIYNLISW